MKKIKNRKKYRKTVVTLHDVIPIAWEANIPCPPDHIEKLDQEEVAKLFPKLMLLYLCHRGCVKSHGLIKANAKALAQIPGNEVVNMDADQLEAHGVNVDNLRKIEQAGSAA